MHSPCGPGEGNMGEQQLHLYLLRIVYIISTAAFLVAATQVSVLDAEWYNNENCAHRIVL
jgi:hypothetical protein